MFTEILKTRLNSVCYLEGLHNFSFNVFISTRLMGIWYVGYAFQQTKEQ